MEIRAKKKDCRKFQKIGIPDHITLTPDETVNTPIIMIHSEGKLKPWTKGLEHVTTFLKYGYVRIRKNCPHRFGKCICEKCSIYVIKMGTGDCAHVWNAVKGM